MRKITYNLDWKTPMVTDTWFYFLSCFFLLTGRDFIFGMSSSNHHVLGVSQNPVLNHYFWKPLQTLSIHERNWPPPWISVIYNDVWSQACNVPNRNSIQNFNREIYMRIFKVLYAAAYFSHRKCKLCLSSPLPSIATFSCWLPFLLSLPLPPSTLLTASSSYLPFLFVTFFSCWTLSFYPL